MGLFGSGSTAPVINTLLAIWFVLAYLLAAVACAFVVLCIGAGVRALGDWWANRSGGRAA